MIPTIINQIQSTHHVKVKDLEPKRDYLYIKDLVHLVDKIIVDDQISGIFNVGSGESYSVKSVIDVISNVMDKNIEIISENNRRENEVMDCVSNINKLKQNLNWSPLYSLKDGLKDHLHEIDSINTQKEEK